MDVCPRFHNVLRVIAIIFLSALLFFVAPLVAHAATTAYTVSEPTTGITITVDTSGSYTISVQSPAWTFGGNVGHTLSNVTVNSGTDSLGSYKEITFQYQGSVARSSGIRTYSSRSVVLFSTTYLAAASNSEAFPTLTTYPQNPYHLSYNGSFGVYGFNLSGADSPWLFFDGQANSFILSPAANFLVANTVKNSDGSISSGAVCPRTLPTKRC